MRADIDAEAEVFPDLLARSVEILGDLFGETLEVVPEGTASQLHQLFRHPPPAVPTPAR
jgi:hypothetical protein